MMTLPENGMGGLGVLLKHAVTAPQVALDLYTTELEPLNTDVADKAKDTYFSLFYRIG